MKTPFQEVLNIAGVHGVVFLSHEGKILAKAFKETPAQGMERLNLLAPIQSLAGISEADLFFVNCRIYLKKKPEGFIMVVMDHFAPMARVRLQCNLLHPEDGEKPSPSKLFKGWFGQRR